MGHKTHTHTGAADGVADDHYASLILKDGSGDVVQTIQTDIVKSTVL